MGEKPSSAEVEASYRQRVANAEAKFNASLERARATWPAALHPDAGRFDPAFAVWLYLRCRIYACEIAEALAWSRKDEPDGIQRFDSELEALMREAHSSKWLSVFGRFGVDGGREWPDHGRLDLMFENRLTSLIADQARDLKWRVLGHNQDRPLGARVRYFRYPGTVGVLDEGFPDLRYSISGDHRAAVTDRLRELIEENYEPRPPSEIEQSASEFAEFLCHSRFLLVTNHVEAYRFGDCVRADKKWICETVAKEVGPVGLRSSRSPLATLGREIEARITKWTRSADALFFLESPMPYRHGTWPSDSIVNCLDAQAYVKYRKAVDIRCHQRDAATFSTLARNNDRPAKEREQRVNAAMREAEIEGTLSVLRVLLEEFPRLGRTHEEVERLLLVELDSASASYGFTVTEVEWLKAEVHLMLARTDGLAHQDLEGVPTNQIVPKTSPPKIEILRLQSQFLEQRKGWRDCILAAYDAYAEEAFNSGRSNIEQILDEVILGRVYDVAVANGWVAHPETRRLRRRIRGVVAGSPAVPDPGPSEVPIPLSELTETLGPHRVTRDRREWFATLLEGRRLYWLAEAHDRAARQVEGEGTTGWTTGEGEMPSHDGKPFRGQAPASGHPATKPPLNEHPQADRKYREECDQAERVFEEAFDEWRGNVPPLSGESEDGGAIPLRRWSLEGNDSPTGRYWLIVLQPHLVTFLRNSLTSFSSLLLRTGGSVASRRRSLTEQADAELLEMRDSKWARAVELIAEAHHDWYRENHSIPSMLDDVWNDIEAEVRRLVRHELVPALAQPLTASPAGLADREGAATWDLRAMVRSELESKRTTIYQIGKSGGVERKRITAWLNGGGFGVPNAAKMAPVLAELLKIDVQPQHLRLPGRMRSPFAGAGERRPWANRGE